MNLTYLNAPITDFSRMAHVLMRAKGDLVRAVAIAANGYPTRPLVAGWLKALDRPIQRAAVNPLTTIGDGAQLSPLAHAATEFINLLRPATLLGRMPEARPGVMNVKVPRQTAGVYVGWSQQGHPMTVSRLSLDSIVQPQTKISGAVVITEELARLSDPAAEKLIQLDMVGGFTQFHDLAFIDPAIPAVADVSPASITYGMPSFPSTGSGAAAVENDILTLINSLIEYGIRFFAPKLILHTRTAAYLTTLRSSGVRVFPDLNLNTGGNILGIPVLLTTNLPVTTDTDEATIIVLLDAAEILLAEGTLEMDASKHAALQLDTDPETGATQLVSLWQNNLVGIRGTRYINWQARREGMAAVLTGVNY